MSNFDDKMIDEWRRKIIAEKEWEANKRGGYGWGDAYRKVPWRKPTDYPPSSEPDYGDDPFGPQDDKPAPKKRKRKPTPKKPKVEPSRITPGVPVRDLIFDEPEKK